MFEAGSSIRSSRSCVSSINSISRSRRERSIIMKAAKSVPLLTELCANLSPVLSRARVFFKGFSKNQAMPRGGSRAPGSSCNKRQSSSVGNQTLPARPESGPCCPRRLGSWVTAASTLSRGGAGPTDRPPGRDLSSDSRLVQGSKKRGRRLFTMNVELTHSRYGRKAQTA
jgi:hypothetical protein